MQQSRVPFGLVRVASAMQAAGHGIDGAARLCEAASEAAREHRMDRFAAVSIVTRLLGSGVPPAKIDAAAIGKWPN